MRYKHVCIELDPQKHYNYNLWMHTYMILKFGSFVVLLDLLKNIFIQMPNTILNFTVNQNFHNIFPMGKP